MKQVNPLRTEFIELNITTKKYAYVSKWYNLEKNQCVHKCAKLNIYTPIVRMIEGN